MTEPPTSRESLYDPTTGFVGVALFEDRLAHAMARMDRVDHQLALLVFTVRTGGDRVAKDDETEALFRSIGHRMRGAVRKVDTLARLGRQDFAVIAEDIREASDASVIARKVEDALSQPFQIGETSMEVTVNGGIAVFPFDGNAHSQLWSAAVAAGNQAAQRGDAFVMANPGLIEPA